ncbi:carboxypeptidase-like regulatory domain-containing protein, partial [bacterium]|nr:carboxypeptidase-like regulatory domain-containing protein [bacterium]
MKTPLLRSVILQILVLVTVVTSSPASPKHGSASSPLDRAITLNLSDVPLRWALSDIERKAGVKFGYSDALIDSVAKASLHVQDRSVSEFLPKFLEDLHIAYQVDEDGHITLFRKSERAVWGFISGSVSDGSSRSPIGGTTIVAIRNGETIFSTTSHWDGSFNMSVPQGEYSIRVNGMEFVRKARIREGQRAKFNIRLKGASFPAVEVYAPTGPKVNRAQLESGFHTLRPSLNAAPHVGSPDLFQTMQALPGVGIFNDYSSKLFIRGSPPG